MSTSEADIEKAAEAFGEQLLGILNNGAVCLTISLGHRTGLFDTLAGVGAADPATIAREAKLDERYVREWLGAATTGGLTEYDAETGKYHLPPERAAVLTRDAYPSNFAVVAQYIPLLASVEDGIVKCFREGGGLPYSAYPRFQEVMAEDSAQSVLPFLEEGVLPLAPGLTDRLRAGIDVLEIGCGKGRALNQLASSFPKSRFVGYELSAEGVEAAQAEAKQRGLDNVRFVQKNVVEMDDADRFDFVTALDAIHDQVDPRKVLGNLHRSLKSDGTFIMGDIGGSSHLEKDLENPLAPLLYTVSTFHCTTVSLSAGGEGLGTMWGEDTARAYLEEAGFKNPQVHRLEGDFQNMYVVCGK